MRGLELISRKTRNEFREFLVGWTLREIENEFSAAGLEPDRNHDPQLGGQRREFVEQYYHALDFTKPSDARRLLSAYENVLNSSNQRLPAQHDQQAAQRAIDALVNCLKTDGYKFLDGKIGSAKPETRKVFDDDPSDHSISELTRQNIFDAIRVGNISWSGRLTEPEFLSRLYDLESMPSEDSRYTTASGDIHKHRVLNDDWTSDWVFTDSRFDLGRASDEALLRFLCEMIHPVVRPDSQDVQGLVQMFNEHLAPDGWEIAARAQLSGRPIFAGRRRVLNGAPAFGSVKSLIQVLNAEYVTQQMTRMEAAIESDPELAIGTAKEFVETICKTILSECGETVSPSADIPQLIKQVREKLDLLPDNVPNKAKGADTIKRVLSNLGTVAQGIAELRGLYGSGHGKHAGAKGLQARHARLAVGAAGTLAVFFFETYQERKTRLAAQAVSLSTEVARSAANG
ncbi:MAG: abortive infection family protein [Rhodopirellula sp.]|nr:abortive infection family protein [Rhodopirellula sp.]